MHSHGSLVKSHWGQTDETQGGAKEAKYFKNSLMKPQPNGAFHHESCELPEWEPTALAWVKSHEPWGRTDETGYYEWG
jgi:hypothetical protein